MTETEQVAKEFGVPIERIRKAFADIRPGREITLANKQGKILKMEASRKEKRLFIEDEGGFTVVSRQKIYEEYIKALAESSITFKELVEARLNVLKENVQTLPINK